MAHPDADLEHRLDFWRDVWREVALARPPDAPLSAKPPLLRRELRLEKAAKKEEL